MGEASARAVGGWSSRRSTESNRTADYFWPLGWKTLQMHLIDRDGNDTCPLPSINDLRRLRMVVDYEEGTVLFKDTPDV